MCNLCLGAGGYMSVLLYRAHSIHYLLHPCVRSQAVPIGMRTQQSVLVLVEPRSTFPQSLALGGAS